MAIYSSVFQGISSGRTQAFDTVWPITLPAEPSGGGEAVGHMNEKNMNK
jgi:hypothetical protein